MRQPIENCLRDLESPAERGLNDQPAITIQTAVQAYEYPATAIDAPPFWWRPTEISREAGDMQSSSAAQEEIEKTEENQLQAFDSEQARAELGLRCEAARQAGFEQGRLVERQAAQAAVGAEHARTQAQTREQLASLVIKFDQETSRYLHEVEREVVELALAIAGRVLRREAQMDPLLLTGAVRVALGQLARTMKAQLKVPESDALLWAEAIAHIPNLTVRPTVVADDGINAGDCLLETELGFVDLGIQSQLAEIERSLFDAAGQTTPGLPASKSVAPGDSVKAAL